MFSSGFPSAQHIFLLWGFLPFTPSVCIAGEEPTNTVCLQAAARGVGNVGNHISLTFPITLKSLNYTLFTQSLSHCFLIPIS